MEDTIDILMATYNGEQYIKDQLKSIESQTYKNWYLIISDDCSTDGTISIIKKAITNGIISLFNLLNLNFPIYLFSSCL